MFALNFDMLGRLRNQTLEVYGVRTAAGLRRLLCEQNAGTDLTLTFDWTQREDSDHWSFYKRRIPYLMLHTGLHEEYHRPSDDAHLINTDGLREVTALCRSTIEAVADAPSWTFRSDCSNETNATNERLSAPLPQPTSRLGIRWDGVRAAQGEFVLTAVIGGSPAATAGLRPGDQVMTINGVAPEDTPMLRRLVLAAPADTTLTIVRQGETIEQPVRLAGAPVRVGLTWRSDAAEPGVVIVRGGVIGSPSDAAGLTAGDRILAVDGERFADADAFRTAFTTAGQQPELRVERGGRLWTTVINLSEPQPSEPRP